MQIAQTSALPTAQRSAGFDAVLQMWRRHKWLAIVVFIVVLPAVLSVVVFLPNVYQSTATILVERQKVPEAFVQTTVTSGIDLRLQAITQQILGRSRLEGLINRFGLYADVLQRVPLEELIERMRQNIRLEQKGGQGSGQQHTTVAFTISYSGKDPQLVAQVTNALASFYIEENLKVREQQAACTTEFLRVQLEEMKQKLETQERLLSKFKEQYIGQLPEQLQANLAVLERLNTQLRLNSEKQARAHEQRATLSKQLAEIDKLRPAVPPPDAPAPEANVTRLERLQQELMVLRTQYAEEYPDIVRLKSEVAALEQHHAATERAKAPGQPVEPPINTYIQQMKRDLGALDVEVTALRAEESGLLRTITLYQQRVENTPRREQDLQGLLRDYDTAQALYQSLLKRHEESKLAESLEQRQKGEQFRLIESATPSQRPAKPDRKRLILMGCFMALGLAVGAVLLVEQLDTSFHTVDDLRAFSQLPVLVSLPRVISRADRRRRRWWFALAAISTVLGILLIVGASYVAIKGQAPLVELYAQLQRLRQ